MIKISNVQYKNNLEDDIYFITTSVGRNIFSSVGISWHSKKRDSYLLYKKEEEINFTKVKPIEEYWSIEESYIEDSYQNKRYVCNVNLKDLDSNTKYIYKIVSGEKTSKICSFKTADNQALKYHFLSFVDFQYSENDTALELVKMFIEKNSQANLITCSGDIADEGYREISHRYLFDSDVFSNSILAFGVGDHEYWATIKSPIKMLKRPYSYNRLFNNPRNGCSDYLNTTYYFKYNKTLFIFLDCGDSNVSSSDEMFHKQTKWIEEVLSKEDYDFTIVSMHKSLYGDEKEDSAIKGLRKIFTKIFDKYQVDLVISGHDHEYSRTKPIYNNFLKEKGTIYLDLGSSGNKVRATGENIKISNLYDKYIDTKENNYSLGIVGVITNEQIKIEVRNQNYDIVDKVEILKKEKIKIN